MGLFGSLFEKKICSICGNEIKFLGNRKIENGNMCKSCTSYLSPWFSDRRSSTVEEINAHLAYRERNKEALERFKVTRVLGKSGKLVYVDETQGKFFVYGGDHWQQANPDIIEFSQITNCMLNIKPGKTEVKKQIPGKVSESFNPPRYSYYWDFEIVINLNHPWFDVMRFDINSSDVTDGKDKSVIENAPRWMPREPEKPQAYLDFEAIGNEIVNLLMSNRSAAIDAAASANEPKTAVQCPLCGATTIPDKNGCCEYCGGALK